MSSLLRTETGTVRKKWKNRLPVGLLYPNTYPLAVSNLGFQLVYSILNQLDFIVCERFVYPSKGGELRSLESNRPLSDFPLILGSISFESDYPNLVAMLIAGGVTPLAESRTPEIQAENPLVIFGGVGVFMNPEPLASFADLMVIGEAEAVLPRLIGLIHTLLDRHLKRAVILKEIAQTLPGCYVPSSYSFSYTPEGAVDAIQVAAGFPGRVKKVFQEDTARAAHSQLLSPDAELGMFMTELGRGCSRGCRFCGAGFIYRPPRLWTAEAVIKGLGQRPQNMDRVGLLGTEMASDSVLDQITGYLENQSCSLSFSSLRADRISEQLLSLLSKSKLKSAAIAPDGCSERLRRVINKGLTENDLLEAASALVSAGIFNLKIYVMIGLPTETDADLDEMIGLIKTLREIILPIGRKRGRVSTISLSVNSFVPKPWTPFQYVPFGGGENKKDPAEGTEQTLLALKRKIKYLRSGLKNEANVRINTDRPETILQQAVFSRGDRRLAPVLLDMASRQLSLKQVLKKHRLTPWEYAIRPREEHEIFPWDVLDHGIQKRYLWQEYQKAISERLTPPCNPKKCRSCGVCNQDPITSVKKTQ